MNSPTETGREPAPDRQGLAYRVLARKYRPQSFDDLIGQAPMVRTLTNAFETGRIAQAWMLTGVRGVGKTTTARILARALNYETDAIRQPTIHMQELGVHCQAIMEGRHVDVVEIDAASHTGIDDIREIIAQVRYRPVAARFKVYIIDEVHMLSTQAFNGLLKTLEEPPEHVKFVFATTEIRKVPITVLSRCQRFDLRRVESGVMIEHLRRVAAAEKVAIDDEAYRLLARASEGSVRDALSLTDQAISHGSGTVVAEAVRDMLGLADRVRVIDLFEWLMKGDARAAISELRGQHDSGADPAVVLSDLAAFAHLVTSLRFVPEAAADAALSPSEVERGLEFSRSLSIRTLSQAYQMLLKGIEEVRLAAVPRQAAEMALIRIAYAAHLPPPEELLALLRKGASPDTQPTSPSSGRSSQPVPPHLSAGAEAMEVSQARPTSTSGTAGLRLAAAPQVQPAKAETSPVEQPRAEAVELRSLEDIAALAEQKRDSLLRVSLRRYVRLVKMEPGRLEVALKDEAPRSLLGDLSRRLHEWTGRRWVVALGSAEGQATIEERETARKDALVSDAVADPEVAAILSFFPGARVIDVRLRGEAEVAPMQDIDAADAAEVPGDFDGDNDDDDDL